MLKDFERKKPEDKEALGAEIKATGFVRFAKGEGIEKKTDDFAAEVASMMK